MNSIFSKIIRFKNSYLLAVVLVFVFLVVSPVRAGVVPTFSIDELMAQSQLASDIVGAGGDMAYTVAANTAAFAAYTKCLEVAAGVGNPLWVTPIQESNMKACMVAAQANDSRLINSTQWQIYADKTVKQALRDKFREALAITFKNSLNLFARTVAHDTAVWVASGGKGQKPLFITEGWGPYLKNVGDSALGDFIDGIGTKFGMDLCQPNFQVRLAIKAGLNYNQPRQVRCSFSKIMNNWQSAISNANFSFEYKESLRPGENDVSFQLIMFDQRNQYVANEKMTAEKTADTNQLWKNITDVAGHILTPGTFIADKFRQVEAKADIGMATFTNTIADVVEEFLNTLVSQLLKNLQAGFFSSTPVDNSGTLDLKPLLALFNPNSSPISVINGVAGAKAKYGGLLSADNYKPGGKYDLLVKLATCSDDAKNNPGPTDCVLDQGLVSAIKSMSYVNDLPQDIKNRVFAPSSEREKTISSNMISYRSILIMRSYRIVPVGWEIAAEIAHKSAQTITLGQILEKFNAQGDQYYRLVDPYWTLKLPELYCRRVGYGEQNSGIKDQSSNISRNEYCTDPMQCLKEDGSGNCSNYGYCEEEKPIWRVGKECEPKSNTCTAYTSRNNAVTNWLGNTLEYRDCTANNVGCRSYATVYNYQSKTWNGDNIIDGLVTRHSSNLVDFTTAVDPNDLRWKVLENHSVSANTRLDLGTKCNSNSCSAITGCVWDSGGKTCSMPTASCLVPEGGISCSINSCYESVNRLASLNPSFELQETGLNTGDSKYWTDELSFNDLNNRHYRASGVGVSGYGLKLVSANNLTGLVTSLPKIPLEAGKTYKLKFQIRGTINAGVVKVIMSDGLNPYLEGYKINSIGGVYFDSSIASWQTVEVPIYNDQNFATGTILIITPEGSITDITLDNFSLEKMTDACSAANVKLYTAPTNETDNIVASNINLDRDAESCGASSAGCSQFIRTKEDLENNLLYNGGFEHGLDGWNNSSGKISLDNNGYALVEYNKEANQVPLESGNFYTMSFDAAQVSGTSDVALMEVSFADSNNNQVAANVSSTNCTDVAGKNNRLYFIPSSVNFERKSCHFLVPSSAVSSTIRITAVNSGSQKVKIDNVKIEKVSYPNFKASPYSVYDPSLNHETNQIAYLTKAPDYYGCYQNEGGAWPSNMFELNNVLAKQATECNNYAKVCIKSEVGCELYTPINGDPQIPGIVDGLDLCPSECSGYQVYKQEATNFIANASYKQFIADKNAKYCSAAYAGCDEFTNLDELGRGAEKKEYYVNFRVCQKPSIDDTSYYTWEGSDTTGYQLKSYVLKKSDLLTAGSGYAPCTILIYDGSGNPLCKETTPPKGMSIASCAQADMATNSDCREFYDVDGNIHHRLLSKTVSVSDNCHPYRRTQTQTTIASAEADCNATSGWWKSATSECIYMAIPQQGRTCSSAVAGCRAYTGNRGNNVRNILSASDFTSATTSDNLWVDDSGSKTDLIISSVSTYPGGNSLSNKNNGNNGQIIKHQVTLVKNRTYTLSFWAKGDESFNDASVTFNNRKDSSFATKLVGENPLAPNITITTDWQRYDLGPVFITWDPSTDSTNPDYLIFNVNGKKIYLDNIILKELSNNIYAIENSWYTPVSCDNKLDDSSGATSVKEDTCVNPISTEAGKETGRCSPGEMLGCTAYKDRASTVWYLRSFNSLCRKEAAGCEALLDTHNSESRNAESFNVGDDNSSMAGLQEYDKINVPVDNLVYLVNDQKTSCVSADKGCTALGLPIVDKWDAVVGYQTVYKKNNPTRYATDLCKHSELWCEEYAGNNSFNYFKDPHGKNCEYRDGWKKIGTDEPCDTTLSQTYGTGDVEAKRQPIGPYTNAYKGWVGNCASDQSSCSEYVDPLPYMYSGVSSSSVNSFKLKANNLYTYEKSDQASVAKVTAFSTACAVEFKSDSTFYLSGNTPICDVTTVNIKKIAQAGVYYALQSTVNYSSCNGQVDFRNGCVLFNDRSQRNMATSTISEQNKYLNYNAIQTYANNMTGGTIGDEFSNSASQVPPVMATGAQADTSKIIKAKSDRQCSKWLYCNSYAKKDPSSAVAKYEDGDRCFGLGTCSSLDSSGNCSGVENETATVSNYSYSKDKNKTGYTKIALTSNDSFYSYSTMDQIGGSAPLANGNFEYTFGDKGEPLGWSLANSTVNWESYMYEIKNDPANAPEGSSYMALKGKHEWKGGLDDGLLSEEIDLIKNTDYYLSYWADTTGLAADANGHSNGENFAQIQLLNVSIINKSPTAELPGAFIAFDRVDAGKNWGRRVIKFNSGDASKVYIQLQNHITYGETGQTLWDDIQIKPLLNANAATNIARTCRAYPETSSRSCQYSGTDKFYYGQYGYCMLNDPKNPKQCLQWWPVDEIKGELMEQYSGYQDMRPLYYCVESQPIKIKLNNFSSDTRVNSANLNDKYQSLSDLDTGKGMKFVPFTSAQIPDAYRALFRYPFVGKFGFIGAMTAIGGVNSGNTGGLFKPFIAKMYKDAVKVNFISITPTNATAGFESCTNLLNNSSDEPKSSQAERILADNNNGEDYCTKLFANPKVGGSCNFTTGCAVYDPNGNPGAYVILQSNNYDFSETSGCCQGNAIEETNNGVDPGTTRYCNNKKDSAESNDPDCQELFGCRKGMQARNIATMQDSATGYYYMNVGTCLSQCASYFNNFASEPAHAWCHGNSNVTDAGNIWFNKTVYYGCVSGSTEGDELNTCERICKNGKDSYGNYRDSSGIAQHSEEFYNEDVLPVNKKYFEDQSDGNGSLVSQIFGFIMGFPAMIDGLLHGSTGEPKFIPDKDSWGGFGIAAFHVNNLVVSSFLPWHLTNGNSQGLSSFVTGLYNVVSTILKIVGVKLPEFGMADGGIRIVTDQDVAFGGSFTDPVPGLPGDILGFVHYLDYQGTKVNGLNMTGVLSSEFTVNYCSKFVKVVTAVGANKAWLDRVSPNSAYNLTANNKSDKSFGNFFYSDPFNFDNLVASLGKCAGVMNDNPLGNRTDYTSSDWKPFGALIAPANSTNEVTWDSKPDVAYRQPLYLEPPLTNLAEPYQPRAGSIHKITADENPLQKLFLKSYGAWKWQDNGIVQSKPNIATITSCANLGLDIASKVYKCLAESSIKDCKNTNQTWSNFIDTCLTPDDSSDDTYIPLTASSSPSDYSQYNWDLLSTWGDTGGYCPKTIRGATEICRLRPVFSEVKVTTTEGNPTLIGLKFNVTIDANQLPITSYTIDWRDGLPDVVTGVSLKQRISTSSPFNFYHNYNFEKLMTFAQSSWNCSGNTCSTVPITITVTDNWNATQSTTINATVTKQ